MTEHDPSPNERVVLPLAHELQPGQRFAGRYRIDRLLGRGATGAVWAAVDEEVGDRVALKLLTAGPDDAADRFRREVRLARRVTHRNAARIFDLGTAGGVLYLTMELVEGESLRDRIEREAPFRVNHAAQIGCQIAYGLSAAHQVGVVHRDIKPANVLLETTGRVVLTDFGLARAVAGDAKVTIGSAMIGTPSYMAPEQVRGETVSPATDLYALGALLYEMLTGTCPFVRQGIVATAMARLEEDPVDPRHHAPMPDDLATLVLRCLERIPDRRPDSAAQVASALAEILEPADSAETLFSIAIPPSGPMASFPSGLGASSPGAGGSASSTFVSIAPEDRTLAVLPFRHRGAQEHSDLAAAIAEDLVDVLSTIRGLRVTASGATTKYEGQSVDPREAGRELGVDAIVEGTVRTHAGSVRISARLVDVSTGEQLWVERFDGPLEDPLALQETTAQRIAESLRLELELLSARHGMPQEAVEIYLEARQRAAATSLAEDSLSVALELLERSLALAPDFGLAMAAHAEYAVRRWFLPAGQDDEAVPRRAHESVRRALEQAPHLALTHLAAGRLAVSDGRFGDAARELTLALSIAPTFAAVHDYLGALQCEAGRGDEGERHIKLARKLDPSLGGDPSLARRCALAGDLDRYHDMVAELRAAPSSSRFMIESLEIRVASWFGDLDTVRRCRPSSYVSPDHEGFRFLEAQRAGLLGEGTPEEVRSSLEALLATGVGPRLGAFMRQLAIEALMPLGALDSALEELRIAAESPVFVDTDWMERCPALDPLRQHPDFEGLTAQVRRRADAIWRVRTS